MRIEQLHVDRFGELNHRLFADISGQLNVFVGSSRDRIQLAQFVRWVLLGRPTDDDAVAGHASGSVTLADRQRRVTFTRQQEGTSYSRLTGADGTAGEAELSRWLGQATAAEFDLFCMPGLDKAFRIQDLLAACESRGVELAGTRFPSTRLQDLRLRADETRRRCQQLPWRGQDLASLLDRQRIQQQRLHGLELELQHRRDDVTLEFQDLNTRIISAEQDIARRRESLRRLDEEMTRRRTELDSVWQQAEDAKRDFVNLRRRELSDTESHLLRARDMLSEIQLRRDAVHDQLDRSDRRPDLPGDRPEATLCMVESLARQLNQMCEIDGRDRNEYFRGSEPIRRPRHSVTTDHLADLRAEVGRLCRTLQGHRELGRRQLLADEAGNLNQSAAVLQRWISDLTRQRDQLLNEIDEATRHGVSLVYDEASECQPSDDDRLWDRPGPRVDRERYATPRFRAVAHACDEITLWQPHEDEHLQSLMRRRDSEDRALMDAETTLRQWIERRRELEDQRWRVREHELDLERQDLRELESLIRTAEERERLERELSQIESEMARCHDEVRPSTVARHAGEMLLRLSGGEFNAVQILDRVRVQVQSTRGGWMDVEHLGGCQRSEVYGSILLAVVTAVRNRGVDLPLFLETVHWEWSPEALHRFISELEALARQGHQVFVLAADDELARQITERGSRRFHVQAPRGDAMPPVELPPPVDSVRFRPHGWPRDANAYRQPGYGPTNGRQPTHTMVDVSPRPWRDSAGSVPEGICTNVPRRAVLGSVGIVPPEVADRLIARGIRTVGEFLASSPIEMEKEVASWGVRAPQLKRWQSELGLCCALAEIGPGDARMLVAAGVDSVQHLAAAEELQLSQRLQQMMSDGGVRNHEARDARLLRSRVADWLHAARRLYPEYHPSDAPSDRHPTRPWGDPSSDRGVARRRRRREVRSEVRPARHPPELAVEAATVPADRPRERSRKMQFHLQLTDDIVNAPSIGPKTAERLRDAGVRTVAEFLAAEPVQLAGQLDNRRITRAIIEAWQSQARLACRIPNLRGHDAQILVACEITSVEDLARMSPDELWDRIRPFLRTNECKRIIRKGKLPDQDEVIQWARSAQHARSLQAA